jgi:hypothetical protein
MFTFSPQEQQGVVTRELRVRVLNCSTSGCLIESNVRIDVGVTASLRVLIDGREFSDDVQVVRCQPIPGAGAVHHIGARFLWTVAPDKLALRRLMQVAATPSAAGLVAPS